MDRTIRWFAGLAMVGMLAACGSGSNSAQAVFQGQQYDLHVQNVDCVAGPATGPAISGEGFLDAPLVCTISYETDAFFSDFVQITVGDVTQVYQQLRTWQVFDGSLLRAEMWLRAVPQPIYGGLVYFDEISNVIGHRVCAEYQIQTGEGEIDGHFCAKVRAGY